MENDFVAPGAVQETPGGREIMGTDLDLLLRCRHIENLVCCGVTTHVCVMSTVYTARNLDYRVLLPQDAVAAVSPDHQAALLCMSDVFAYITTVDEICKIHNLCAHAGVKPLPPRPTPITENP